MSWDWTEQHGVEDMRATVRVEESSHPDVGSVFLVVGRPEGIFLTDAAADELCDRVHAIRAAQDRAAGR